MVTKTKYDRIKVGYTMNVEVERMLRKMSKDDLRTLSGQLEYVIKQEYARRNRTLIDTRGRYEVEVEP